MGIIRLTAAVVFLTGFWGALYAAAQHGDHSHGEHSATPASAGTEKDPVAVKTEQEAAANPAHPEKMKGGGGMKEKAVKAALQKHNCLLCHKYKGKGGTAGPALDGHLKHHSNAELKKLLKNPKPPMPPFSGADKELDEFVEEINYKAAASSGAAGRPGAKKTLKIYVCPMDEYESGKPGKCPKCGMDLVEKR